MEIYSNLPIYTIQRIITYLDYNSQLECLSPYKYKNTKKINKGICEIKKNIFAKMIIKYKIDYSDEWLEWLENIISYWLINKNFTFNKTIIKTNNNYKNIYFRIYNIPKTDNEYFTLIDSLCDNNYCNCGFFNCDCIPEALERIIDVFTIQEVKDFYNFEDYMTNK